MQHNTDTATHQIRARALLADLEAATGTVLPRREPIVTWLNAFLTRSEPINYVMGDTEAEDLLAIEQLLRTYEVPVSVRDAA